MLRTLRDSFKHTSIYTVGNLATKAVGLLMIPVYTHYLKPSEYGIMDILDLTIILIGTVVGMGLGSSLFRFYYAAESEQDRRDVVGSALMFSVVSAGIVGLTIVLASRQLSALIFRTPGYALYLQVAILSFWIGMIAETCRTYIRARQQSAFFVVTSLIQLVISLSLNIYFIVFRHLGVFGFLLSSLITNVLASVGLLIHTLAETGFSVSIPKTRHMLMYGAPFVFSGLGHFVLNFADRYFLNAYANLTAVGIYALGYKFGFMLNMLASAPFLQMWDAQVFIVEKEPNAKAVYARIFEYFAALILFAVLVLSVFIKDLLHVMASPEYFAAHRIVPIVALAYVFNGWGQYFRLGMLLTRRTRPIGVIMMGTGAVTLVLYVILIRAYHEMGAAVATLLSFCLMMVWTFAASQRMYPVPYDFRRIGEVLGIAGLCYAVAWIADRMFGPFTLHGYLIRILAVAAYPVVLVVTGFFASEGIHRLRDLPAGIRRIARGGDLVEP
jgi:O-antigen/teichoic acid export membrane protein